MRAIPPRTVIVKPTRHREFLFQLVEQTEQCRRLIDPCHEWRQMEDIPRGNSIRTEIVQRIQEERVVQTPDAVGALFFECAEITIFKVRTAFRLFYVDTGCNLIPDIREKSFSAVISLAFILHLVRYGRGQRLVSLAQE